MAADAKSRLKRYSYSTSKRKNMYNWLFFTIWKLNADVQSSTFGSWNTGVKSNYWLYPERIKHMDKTMDANHFLKKWVSKFSLVRPVLRDPWDLSNDQMFSRSKSLWPFKAPLFTISIVQACIFLLWISLVIRNDGVSGTNWKAWLYCLRC